MSWETYRGVFKNFGTAMSQIEILTFVGNETIKDFPSNLPLSLKDPLLAGMRQMSNVIGVVLKASESGKRLRKSIAASDSDPTKGKLLESVVTLIISSADVTKPKKLSKSFQIGFERLLGSQKLVMSFAYLDAFMADTLRAVCAARPEILKSAKKIDWATALGFEKKDDLIVHLVERYVYDFGWLTLSKRLEFLRKEFGLDIAPPEKEIELLHWAENIRHVAVHNGGRVSAEFIERTGKTELVLGEFVPIEFDELEKMIIAVRLLAGDLFTSVSKKFFGVGEHQLTGFLRRGRGKANIAKKRATKKTINRRHR
ncbi:MAG TPA: hypothetical protein VHE60_05905 [Pyrinomonadaceae bacterium]|nr:hypothetical protein [Pyrinomonadaceae bacterium]